MLLRKLVQFLIGCMDVILIIHLLKLRIHKFFFFIHIFNNPFSRIDSGSEGIQNSVILIVGIILKLGVAQSNNKCLAHPYAFEICRTFLFHVTEVLTSKSLRSCGNNVLTAIPCIILPFVLALELRRTRLPTVLVEALSIGILHKLLELPSDVGLYLGIFIVERLICVTALSLQCHTLTFTRLANP